MAASRWLSALQHGYGSPDTVTALVTPGMSDRYAVMGNPIGHSKSPRIHALFARQTGADLVYDSILVPLDGFAAAVTEFEATGGRGLNITVPFKLQAWSRVDQRTARAEHTGAVNTIAITPTGLLGDNTDGAGLIQDLRNNHALELAGQRILILGAGGAVRGVAPSLLAEAPAELVIANRTRARAEAIAASFADLGQVTACSLPELAGERFDLIINGTSAGLRGEIPTLPEKLQVAGAIAYDMVYGATTTAFCQWALRQGAAHALDGLGMLVEQAAESFLLWRGIRPKTTTIIQALRQ